jgi:hypothetical protein
VAVEQLLNLVDNDPRVKPVAQAIDRPRLLLEEPTS